MAVTYGFYNSVNHDRVYDAEQMSSMFDGLILDGVFKNVGNELTVRSGTAMTVIVESGRAWFDHTWTFNDSALVLDISPSSSSYNRIDSVILEVNKSSRTNTIKILMGVNASSPVPPALQNDNSVSQYRLANVSIPKSSSTVTVTDTRGTDDCPWARSPIYTAGNDNYYTKEEADTKFGAFTFSAGTADLTAGTSDLATNKVYFCYE